MEFDLKLCETSLKQWGAILYLRFLALITCT
jgi:hypothetical protein